MENTEWKYVCLVAFLITCLFYWPIFKPIKIENSQSSKKENIAPLNFNLSNEFLSSYGVALAPKRHLLCLLNFNRVYLVNADSPIFQTPNVAGYTDMKKQNVGAMAVDLNYKNGLARDEVYTNVREFNCSSLDSRKLLSLASSTITYHHSILFNETTLHIPGYGDVNLDREVGSSNIDTYFSFAFITPHWGYFVGTWLIVFAILLLPIFNYPKRKIAGAHAWALSIFITKKSKT